MLYSLQIGRALAALAVAVSHCIITTNMVYPHMPEGWLALLKLGYLGVDYFFVLSGFIIAYVTNGVVPNMASAKHYGLSRALRIYVPYLPVTLGLFALIFVMQYLGMSGHRDPYSITASLLLTPSNDLPLLSVAWSLQHEMVFYALFGLCFFIFKDARLIFLWAVGIVTLLCFTVTDRWWNVVLGIINLEFLFGIVAYYLYRSGTLKSWRYLFLILGGALLVLAGSLLIDSAVIHYLRIIAGVGFAFVVLGLVYMEKDIDFSRYRTLVFLGSASYAIYLVHAPFLAIIDKLMPPLLHWSVTFVILLGLCCFIGAAYHLMIEVPLMRIVRSRLGLK